MTAWTSATSPSAKVLGGSAVLACNCHLAVRDRAFRARYATASTDAKKAVASAKVAGPGGGDAACNLRTFEAVKLLRVSMDRSRWDGYRTAQSSRRTANRDRRWQLDDLSSPYVLRKALAGSGALTEINSTIVFFCCENRKTHRIWATSF